MPPEISPPLSPQQLLAQCRWPAAPHQLPARLAPTHQDAGSRALLSLLPPCSQCPMPTVGLGWGRVTPVPWCQSGGPRPLGPTDKAQDPVLKPSHQEAVHGPGPHREAGRLGTDSPMSSYGRLHSPRWRPVCLSATRRQPPSIPPAQANAWAPKSLQFLRALVPAACKGVGWGCCLPFDPHKGGNQPRGQGAGRESMGPLHFTTARGSRAGCGHLLGGALRQEWVACLSRGDGCQSWVHGITGEQDGENQVGGFRGYLCSSSSQSWLLLPSRNISRLHQIERSRTTTPSMHHNCFACTLGVVVPLRSLVLFFSPEPC